MKDDSTSGNDITQEPPKDLILEDKKLEAIDEGLLHLLSVFEHEKLEEAIGFRVDQDKNALFSAIRHVGKAMGIQILIPTHLTEKSSAAELIEAISEASQCRVRSQTLSIDWWHQDCGPLLGFRQSDGSPVAFIQKKEKYWVFDPTDDTFVAINNNNAENYSNLVYRLYKSLPDEPLNWRHLFKFAFPFLKKDFQKILSLEFYAGVLALLIPIVTGIVFETLIPNADIQHLKQIIILLAITTIVSTGFGLSQALYILRFRLRSDVAMQSAVWDRVLRLPLKFFHQFLAGDLAIRVSGVDEIQQFVTSSMFTTILGGFFSILSLGLMFYYDVWLSLAAILLAIIAVLISLGFNLIQVRYQRPMVAMFGKMTGAMYQLLSSINKLRVANRENEAFGVWAKIFSVKNKLFFSAQLNIIAFGIFYPFFSILSTIVIYSLVVARGKELSFGHFIAFNAAFGQFFGSLLSMASVINQLIMIVPYYERIKPILEAVPELENLGVDPGVLTGRVRIQNLSFRYSAETPFVLEHISIDIQPGSFIALVGPSGSGKSTLFRLLLSFEELAKETIFYDERDLIALNKRALRKQIGVVTQNTMLLSGSIYESITGLSPELSMVDAIEAAREMCILDEIKAMPMGMHTWIAEGSKNISVGQRQRILLAHAIARKPRILFLDEATSALDNKTQSLIHNNLKKYNITRLVAAHRLSMVKEADCIYVLEHGRIVQSGHYQQLLETPGLFATLAQRQLL